MIPSRLPPRRERGVILWLRKNLFHGVGNTLTTLFVGYAVVRAAMALIGWMVTGAAWQPVWDNLRLLAVYRYPVELLWRPMVSVALVLALLGLGAGLGRRAGKGQIIGGVFWWFSGLAFVLTALALFQWPSVRGWWVVISVAALAGYGLGLRFPRLARIQAWSWAVALPAVAVLLYGTGGVGRMATVSTHDWGGFMLTLVLAGVGITVSFPLGVALALGRRSRLPAIKYFCIGFIELIRGAPLITWLFIASLMVPLLLDVSPDSIPAIARALVAITLFSAAYMAENVRGGLQSVPGGQGEAARALGLSGWQTMQLIILPQALRAVIPAIVGQAISLFKDTSLVFIVGLLDFFEIGRRVIPSQPESLQYAGGVLLELSLFMAAMYWFFCYRMSMASRQLEKHLGVGER
ncbi:MAG: amino acid ABC transporter permease [Trueperaceae bacterium]|nr:amino acid ABC transporter permease [Trueperaceae bacterium]